eukprot:1058408-Rhodomonas_salina.1
MFDEEYFPFRKTVTGPARWPALSIPEDEIKVEDATEDSTPVEYEPYVLRSTTAATAGGATTTEAVPEEVPLVLPDHPRDLRVALGTSSSTAPATSRSPS